MFTMVHVKSKSYVIFKKTTAGEADYVSAGSLKVIKYLLFPFAFLKISCSWSHVV